MKFIKEHKIIISVLILIMILCIGIVVSYKTEGKRGVVGSFVGNSVFSIQKLGTNISFDIKDNFNGFFKYKKIMEENEKLQIENSNLKQEIIDIKLNRYELKELKKLKKVLDYIPPDNDNQIKVATIIALDDSNLYNHFIIDCGKDYRLKEGSIVIHEKGLVGTVIEVGDNWSKVVSIIDDTKNVSFTVVRNPELLGIIHGNGKKDLSGFMLDNEASIIEGDTIITSGIGMFPKGIIIGEVKKVKYNKDTQLKTVEVEPSVEFNSLQKVAVII